MPTQRVVVVLPEQPDGDLLAVTVELRDHFEMRGYRVSIRYGEDGFDEDLTPIDGVELQPLMIRLSVG